MLTCLNRQSGRRTQGDAMKNSGIGGQAVMEGVMMRNKNRYAVACRKPDGEIVVDVKETHSIGEKYKFLAWPFLRGAVNLIESMVIGIKALTYSADFIDDGTDDKKKADAKSTPVAEPAQAMTDAEPKTEPAQAAEPEPIAESVQTGESRQAAGAKQETVMTPGAIALTVVLSLALTIALFFFLPVFITGLIESITGWDSPVATSVIEGILRMAIFITYVAAISLMPDIKRVYRYHGAEHKSINCIEHGFSLTVENVRNSSKEHKRCGTSFLLLVMVISILVFSVVNCFPLYEGDSAAIKLLVRFGTRLLLLPLVAGISYEFLRLAGRSDNKIVNAISRPGLWMQALTTKEPDDAMIECAIASVEAVFDWKAFLNGDNGNDLSGSTETGGDSAGQCGRSGCGL